MTYERVQKASSWSSQPQEKTSPFARRPFTVPAQAPTQQEIENEAIQKNKLEAFGLELQAKHGTITPEGQERLTVLQAKMDAFWQQRRESIERRGGNILQRLLNQGGTRTNEPPPMIQTKLTIGEPGDQYEQEADQVAARVVNQINAPAPQQLAMGESVQREEQPEEEKLMTKPEVGIVQRQPGEEGMAATPDLEASIQQARGSGQPLTDSVREPMEQAFGADFSGVKVHTDAQSDQLNQSIQAKAFTTGQDIFFRQGAYEPGSRGGQELIAHELTHVVQQNGTAVEQLATRTSSSSSHSEQISLAVSSDRGVQQQPTAEAQTASGITPFQSTLSVAPLGIQRTITYQANDQQIASPITDVSQAITSLGQLAATANRNSANFANYQTQLEQIISDTDTVLALTEANPVQSVQDAVLQINNCIGLNSTQLIEEIVAVLPNDCGVSSQGNFTYQYGWGKTAKVDTAIRGKINPNQVIKQQNNPYKEIRINGTPILFTESLDSAGPTVAGNQTQRAENARVALRNTNILNSATWMSARVDCEFTGVVGEYLANQNLNLSVPPPTNAAQNVTYIVLSGVHFIGNLYTDPEGTNRHRQNTDVCAELDLMRIENNNGTLTIVSMSNVKAVKNNSAASQAKSARNQNADAQTALTAYLNKQIVPIGEYYMQVNQVFGENVQDGSRYNVDEKTKLNLGNSRPGTDPPQSEGQHTIGLQGQTQFTGQMPYTFQEVQYIAHQLWQDYKQLHHLP
jgi:hypothetical protein